MELFPLAPISYKEKGEGAAQKDRITCCRSVPLFIREGLQGEFGVS